MQAAATGSSNKQQQQAAHGIEPHFTHHHALDEPLVESSALEAQAPLLERVEWQEEELLARVQSGVCVKAQLEQRGASARAAEQEDDWRDQLRGGRRRRAQCYARPPPRSLQQLIVSVLATRRARVELPLDQPLQRGKGRVREHVHVAQPHADDRFNATAQLHC